MARNRPKQDPPNSGSSDVNGNANQSKRKSSEDLDADEEKRGLKAKRSDKSKDIVDHGSLDIDEPAAKPVFVAPTSVPVQDYKDDSDSENSEDGSLSDVYAYANNTELNPVVPAAIVAPPSSSSYVEKDVPNFQHTDAQSSSRHRWTPEMDALLREAWNIYGKQWKKISAHVGHNKDRSQCQHRWAVYLDPQLSLRKNGPWSDEETMLLKELVEKHRNVKNGNESSTNWVAVAKESGRSYKECRNRWKVLTAPTGKKGPFTEAEDQVIIKGVREWPVKKPGIWTALQKVLNRRAKSICRRWTSMLSHENLHDPVYYELMKSNYQQQQQQQQHLQHTLLSDVGKIQSSNSNGDTHL